MKRFQVLVGCICFLSACSLQRMALDQTAGILKQALPAFEQESDFELAAAALPGNIKVLEGFLQAGPDNTDLLELVAKSYASYALVVLEDKLEQAEELSDAAEKLAGRTKVMYLRSHRFGLKLLEVNHSGFTASFKKGRETLAAALKELEKDDVPGLFWAGMPLFSAVNVAKDDVTMVGKIPWAKALVERVAELDETYFNAAPHMVLGAMYGSVGKMLGGDAPRSKKHFERALELTKRRFLMIQVFYAQTYAVQVQNKKLFLSLLNEVMKAKLSIYPEQRLANVAAKRRAKRLLAKAGEFF